MSPDLDHVEQASEEIIAAAAQAAHEANRAWCQVMRDYSQLHWEDAPQWQRDSAIAGVRRIWLIPSTTPEQSHIAWLAMKLGEGWVYGPVKDVEAKTHPCCAPYDQLPPLQRAKDAIFGDVVRSVLYAAGLIGKKQ